VRRKTPADTPLSQAWVAFDLLRGGGGGFMAKVYFMPILKMIETGRESKALVFEAVKACDGPHGSFDAPVAMLAGYMASFPAGEGPVVEMVAIDCTDSPGSRIKIYLRTSVNTLARAKWAFRLGGRLTGEVIDQGIAALEELWPILFRLGSEDVDEIKVFPDGSYCGNAIEMRADRAAPEVKLHIPVRKINGTDAQLCASLSEWFKRRGHGEFAARYRSDLEAAL
jgi:DMATS type aromatic prenyltransferase